MITNVIYLFRLHLFYFSATHLDLRLLEPEGRRQLSTTGTNTIATVFQKAIEKLGSQQAQLQHTEELAERIESQQEDFEKKVAEQTQKLEETANTITQKVAVATKAAEDQLSEFGVL